MRRIFFVVLGWALVVAGAIIVPLPIPIPMAGIAPLLLGCAILSAHSKSFRRGLQYIRLRFSRISRLFEGFRERGPQPVRAMVRRTHPLAMERHARMRAREKGI